MIKKEEQFHEASIASLLRVKLQAKRQSTLRNVDGNKYNCKLRIAVIRRSAMLSEEEKLPLLTPQERLSTTQATPGISVSSLR